MTEQVERRREKRTEHDVWMRSYNAGRLAGLREAAQVAWLQSKQGATHEQIRLAVLALANEEK